MVGAVLMDVGGTLWPDVWPSRPTDPGERISRLTAIAAGNVGEETARRLATALTEHPPTLVDGGRQETDGAIAVMIDRLELGETFPDPAAVRRAVCLPALGHVELLPGAAELLRQLAAAGVPVVLLSNTLWRDSEAYLDDFASFGLGDAVSSAVSSVDIGFRKPHPAMFEAALGQAGLPPGDCVVVGDSEVNDVAPARSMGCRAIRVAIERAAPVTSTADAVHTSLDGVVQELLG